MRCQVTHVNSRKVYQFIQGYELIATNLLCFNHPENFEFHMLDNNTLPCYSSNHYSGYYLGDTNDSSRAIAADWTQQVRG